MQNKKQFYFNFRAKVPSTKSKVQKRSRKQTFGFFFVGVKELSRYETNFNM